MALTVTHTKVVTIPDDPNYEVGSDEWNANHTITLAADSLVGAVTAGAATEITCTAAGRALLDDASAAAQRTTLGLAIGTDVQAWDADLDALAGLSSAGLVARTGAGTAAARTLGQPAAGFIIGNPDGAAGNPTFALANDLAALEGLGSTGLAVRSASDTWVQRSVAGTANEITATNGDGVSGNPTLSLPAALTFTGKTVTGGTFDGAVGKGTWTASGTWTLPAFTLGGTVSGGGQQLNNVIIGTSTPLAGAFTTLSATGLITATGGQIAFPATQSASADANTLDDYEEGTWTPVFTFATPGDLSVAYTTQSADYTKTGREVRATGQTLLSSFTHTTASGQAQITGLPFTSANTSHSTVGSTAWTGITKASYTQVGAFILGNQSVMRFYGFGSGVAIAAINAADMPTGGTPNLASTCSYHV